MNEKPEHRERLRRLDEPKEIWQADAEGRTEPMTQNDWAYLYGVLNEHDKMLTAQGQPTTPNRMKLLSKLAQRMHEKAVSDG